MRVCRPSSPFISQINALAATRLTACQAIYPHLRCFTAPASHMVPCPWSEQEREERAVSEKIQLEQKLKLQRVELHKQANQMQSAEDKTRAELFDLQVRGWWGGEVWMRTRNLSGLGSGAVMQRQGRVSVGAGWERRSPRVEGSGAGTVLPLTCCMSPSSCGVIAATLLTAAAVVVLLCALQSKTTAHRGAIDSGATTVRTADSKTFASEKEELQREVRERRMFREIRGGSVYS